MRLIVTTKLQNSNHMVIVGDVQNKEQAKAMAIQLSPRFFADKSLHISKESPIINVEKWSQERGYSYQPGNKTYIVAFLLDNITQILQVEANGIKSAYNNIKVRYGINENLFMMIYELNQVHKRKSSMNVSKEVIRDNRRTTETLNKAADKARETPELGEYIEDLWLLFGMIRDYCNGSYRDIPTGTIIGALACVIYFLSPIDLIPDVVPVIGQLDDITVLIWALKQLRGDIQRYKYWTQNKNSTYIDTEEDDDMIPV